MSNNDEQIPSSWAAVERELFATGPEILPFLAQIDGVLDCAGSAGRSDLSKRVAEAFIGALRQQDLAVPLMEVVKRQGVVDKLKREAADGVI